MFGALKELHVGYMIVHISYADRLHKNMAAIALVASKNKMNF
jgi:hypothetical protein